MPKNNINSELISCGVSEHKPWQKQLLCLGSELDLVFAMQQFESYELVNKLNENNINIVAT